MAIAAAVTKLADMAAETEEATLPAVAEALLMAATEAFDAVLAAAVAAADMLEATAPALAPAAEIERAER